MSFQDVLVRQVTEMERRLDAVPLPELSADLESPFLALTGLRGFWSLGTLDATGQALDQSGNGRTLSYFGDPLYNYIGRVPYLAFDGTGDYLSRADEAGLDILGTETYVAAACRGLTLGGWFYPQETGTNEYLISKWGAAGQRSYHLRIDGTDAFVFAMSDDGTNTSNVTSAVVSVNNWHFVVGRFDPGVEVNVLVNMVEVTNATARASIFNSNASFDISGRAAGTGVFEGYAALCFLCAAYLSDIMVMSLFQRTRAAFGI